jgi:hypothetical protein
MLEHDNGGRDPSGNPSGPQYFPGTPGTPPAATPLEKKTSPLVYVLGALIAAAVIYALVQTFA